LRKDEHSIAKSEVCGYARQWNSSIESIWKEERWEKKKK